MSLFLSFTSLPSFLFVLLLYSSQPNLTLPSFLPFLTLPPTLRITSKNGDEFDGNVRSPPSQQTCRLGIVRDNLPDVCRIPLPPFRHRCPHLPLYYALPPQGTQKQMNHQPSSMSIWSNRKIINGATILIYLWLTFAICYFSSMSRRQGDEFFSFISSLGALRVSNKTGWHGNMDTRYQGAGKRPFILFFSYILRAKHNICELFEPYRPAQQTRKTRGHNQPPLCK